MRAAAGTSIMTPTRTDAATGTSAWPQASTTESSTARAARTSSTVATIGNMTRSSPPAEASRSARSCTSSSSGWRRPRRIPRTPRAGFASRFAVLVAGRLVAADVERPEHDRDVAGRLEDPLVDRPLLVEGRRDRSAEEQQLCPEQADPGRPRRHRLLHLSNRSGIRLDGAGQDDRGIRCRPIGPDAACAGQARSRALTGRRPRSGRSLPGLPAPARLVR